LPILSPKKLVVLKDYLPGENERVIEYFEDLPESTILVLTYEEGAGKPKAAAGKKNDGEKETSNRRPGRDIIYKMVKSKGKIYDFGPLGRIQLSKFISKRLRGLKKEADPSLISMIIAESGYYNRDGDYSLYNTENDVKKMADHCSGSELTGEDVLAGLSENLERNIFAMLDAVSGNRKDEAFRLLYDLLRSGESPPKLIAITASQLELMLCIKEMRQEGKTRIQMEKEMNVHEYRLKKAMGFAEKYSERELRRILHSVYETDGRIKTGFLEPKMALEMMIAGI
nr:DNA polymerase III subunit delta [Bacillota bacterium]